MTFLAMMGCSHGAAASIGRTMLPARVLIYNLCGVWLSRAQRNSVHDENSHHLFLPPTPHFLKVPRKST